MSPLLGRPAPDPAAALARGGILAAATLLAWTPLSLLFTAPSWWFVPLCSTIAVLGVGALARALVPVPALVPVIHLGTVMAVTVFAELTTGVLEAQHGIVDPGTGLLDAQVAVLRAGIEEIGGGRAPVDLTGPGQVVLTLAVSLVVVVLDLLFLDLGWHTPTGFLLLALMLVPALMYPAGGPWWTATGPLAGALIVFAARTLHADGSYLHGDERPHTGPLSRRTAVTALTAGTIGAVLAGAPMLSAILPRPVRPLLPLDIDTINAWRGQEATDLGAVMIDDSISVRRDLMRRGETEVLRMTVSGGDPDYLRLHTLTRFDGASFRRGDGWAGGGAGDQLPEALTDRRLAGGPPADAITYQVSITSLQGDALPAPPAIGWYSTPLDGRIAAAGAADGTLLLEDGVQDLSGIAYEVASRPAGSTAAQLRAVSTSAFTEPFDAGYLAGDVPPMIADLAEQVAAEAGAAGAYDTARAFVAFFHAEFDYSLSVTTQPGSDPIASFLTERIGYCEQFAATFALMMDARGYPTRVAIGFTGGTEDGEERTVTNHNAHAWPEVWFGADHGWVRFEPTPPSAGSGTSAPGHEGEDAPAEQTTPATAPSAEQTTAPVEQTSSSAETPSETTSTASEDGGTDTGGAADAGAGEGPGTGALVLGGVVLGGAGIGGGLLWRARRRARARDARWAGLGPVEDAARAAAVAAGAEAVAAGTGVVAAEAEAVRRAAAQLAWEEIGQAIARRRRAIRLLGWTGRWGRPPGDLELDATLTPSRALAALLERLATLGRWAGKGSEAAVVTDRHREAAARIGAALEASRYAPPPTRRAPIAASASDRRSHAAPAADPRIALREDSDLLLALIRSL